VIETRREKEIHHEGGGWFDARWHFSFGGYRDPEQMGVGALRVFNDDRIVAGADWPMHPHRDIESLTYVVDGHFLHADSLGNNGRLEGGAAQVMSFSGEGDQHSERNGSKTEPMRFIQFWILPSNPVPTSVQQHQYQLAERTDRWLQIMGPAGEEGLDLAQDARALVSRLSSQTALEYHWPAGRGGYVHVIDGEVTAGADGLEAGDALKIFGPEHVELRTSTAAELILIDTVLDFEPTGVWRPATGGR